MRLVHVCALSAAVSHFREVEAGLEASSPNRRCNRATEYVLTTSTTTHLELEQRGQPWQGSMAENFACWACAHARWLSPLRQAMTIEHKHC